MSAPRIKVRLGHSPVLRKIHNAWVNQGWRRKFYWHCTGCTPSQFESNGGTADTLASAADAGRAHLAEHHAQGYCRLHGVHRSVCGCRVASVDPDALGGRENAAQAIQILSDAILGHMRHIVTANEHLLAKVDSAPEKPSEALQRLFDTTRSDT